MPYQHLALRPYHPCLLKSEMTPSPDFRLRLPLLHLIKMLMVMMLMKELRRWGKPHRPRSPRNPATLSLSLGQSTHQQSRKMDRKLQQRGLKRRYRAEKHTGLNENPLTWWRSNEREYPLLARLGKQYLCVPGTNIVSERVFSTAGDIVTAKMSCLTPDHVNELLFLHKNLTITK